MNEEHISNLHGDRPAAVTAKALLDRRELSATAFQRTRMPMVVTDATQQDNPIVLANQSFLNLTGYGADEVLGRDCRFLQGPETSRATVAEIRAGLLESREVNVEILNYKKDGTAFWNQLYLSPIQDVDGRTIYHFASQLDRTDYHRIESLEASEHRLLREVDHRANNALALVESIVRLSRSDDAILYAAAVQGRVHALATAHDLMASHGWHEISLRRLIGVQVDPYRSNHIKLNGDDVALEPHAIQPIALFIHELAVNAATHGSLTMEGGRVDVSWGPSATVRGLGLLWTETGGPPVPVKRRAGFGTMVADATIGQQLNGSVYWDWSVTGLKVAIDVPHVITA